jgi:putative membrane protein
MKVQYALALSLLVAVGCQDNDKSTDKSSKKMSDTSSMKNTDLSAADRQFILTAASSGNFEVLSSELALTKPVDAKTRTFAQRMVTDHTKVNSELMTLAGRKGVTVPTKLMAKHEQMLDELRKTSDDGFQKKYHDAQMAGHDEAIALFEKTSKDANDPDIKAFATKNLPALKEHKQMMH